MRIVLKPRLWADRRGNVAMMFALSLPIFLLGGGLALDYAREAEAHTKLLAAADAAALAAVTPAMMNDLNLSDAQAAAQNAFAAVAAGVGGLMGTPVPTVTVTVDPNNPLLRHVTVSFAASTNNMFAGLVGMPTATFSGQAHASAQQAPNIDFYVLLDNSPSMALPQDQNGIDAMNSHTTRQGGCALACHMAAQPNSDTAGNPYYNPTNAWQVCPQPPFYVNSSGQTTTSAQDTAYNPPAGCIQMDNYALARSLNIPLRIDNLTAGMTALLKDADNYRATLASAPNYSFTVNTMDSQYAIGFTNLMPKTVNTYSTSWAAASQNLNIMEYYANDQTCASLLSDPCGKSGGVKDVATNYEDALSKQVAQISPPGNGSNRAGDKPQAIVFIVTDGVEDDIFNGQRVEQPLNGGGGTNYCDKIKATGAKIAILYTTYLPLPNNGFYNTNVAYFQPQIAPALQACATPGLFVQAQVGQDLGVALGQLFQAATQFGHLTN